VTTEEEMGSQEKTKDASNRGEWKIHRDGLDNNVSLAILQGNISFGPNGIREVHRLQVYQYRYKGELQNSTYACNHSDTYVYINKRCSKTSRQLSHITDGALERVVIGSVLEENESYQFVYLPGEEEESWPGGE